MPLAEKLSSLIAVVAATLPTAALPTTPTPVDLVCSPGARATSCVSVDNPKARNAVLTREGCGDVLTLTWTTGGTAEIRLTTATTVVGVQRISAGTGEVVAGRYRGARVAHTATGPITDLFGCPGAESPTTLEIGP
ncbi:hypothetical protein [Actinosynnema sp. NPDC020468]|uniref:hypothetical protein n=1 Tax=Actinosynnema sp. NPDC020468 TaxID=3154488 RepID=UPI0033CD6F6E